MIEGCLHWQEQGLAPPEAVTAPTDAYLEAEDAIAAWIEEECDRDPDHWEARTSVYESWKGWAEKNGEHVGSARGFYEKLEARGMESKRRGGSGTRGFVGLKIKVPVVVGDYWEN